MSPKPPKTPTYRLHKPTGQAVVRLDGKDHYLGKHGTAPSQEAYRRLIAAWLTCPHTPSASEVKLDLDIDQLVLAYWDRHVVGYYVKSGRPTSEQDNIRQALRFLRRLYGHLPVQEFGPLALKAVRQAMIKAGRCRKLINKDINRIKGLFRWGVEHELVPVAIHQSLRAVSGLRQGRSEAKEAEPIGAVPEAAVQATLPYLSAQVAAMVQLQLLTGARPAEVIAMRPGDIEFAAGGIWVYRPVSHMAEHLARDRVIILGPLATLAHAYRALA